MTKTYTSDQISRLIWETKNIADHESLARLLEDLHAQGDLDFDGDLRKQFSSPKHYFRFVKSIYSMDKLCEFNLKLMQLQQNDLAVITLLLTRRIEFQREMILRIKNNKNT